MPVIYSNDLSLSLSLSGSSDDEVNTRKDLHPISHYIDDRPEMIRQVELLLFSVFIPTLLTNNNYSFWYRV